MLKKDLEEKILKIVSEKGKIKTRELSARFGFSRQYVSHILSGLVKKGELIRIGATNSTYYTTPDRFDADQKINRRFANKNLQEHEVYQNVEEKFAPMKSLPDNIGAILNYAFSEMLNNAIEHSESKNIEIEVGLLNNELYFIVDDFGIGAFRNIMNKRGLSSELEAIQDLLKGKVTTQPQAHTGEGIFFTSKVADVFILDSFEYRLRVDNNVDDVFVEELPRKKEGTRVKFIISKTSKKHLSDVFKKYQTDNSLAFDKTEVRIKLFIMGTIYMSRSQARRVLLGLEKFKKIILDFDKVPTVGQAFVDEIFRVFSNRYPDIEIKPVNMNETVKFMVERGIQNAEQNRKLFE